MIYEDIYVAVIFIKSEGYLKPTALLNWTFEKKEGFIRDNLLNLTF